MPATACTTPTVFSSKRRSVGFTPFAVTRSRRTASARYLFDRWVNPHCFPVATLALPPCRARNATGHKTRAPYPHANGFAGDCVTPRLVKIQNSLAPIAQTRLCVTIPASGLACENGYLAAKRPRSSSVYKYLLLLILLNTPSGTHAAVEYPNLVMHVG